MTSAVPFNLAASLREFCGAELAEGVIDLLLDQEFLVALGEAVHSAVVSADSAWSERPDLFENPRSSRVITEVVIEAATRLLRDSRPSVETPPPEALAGAIRRLAYKDWEFRLVMVTAGIPAVQVRANLDNTFHPGNPFRTTRSAVIVGDDVVGAAFRAVMQIESHEARERLRLGSTAALDPHGIAAVPPPTNVRRRTDSKGPA